jgi:hypothetical protein
VSLVIVLVIVGGSVVASLAVDRRAEPTAA